jgi:hypothetical protein
MPVAVELAVGHDLEPLLEANLERRSRLMPLNYAKHESISLRKHSDFSEIWLHDRIAADPEILGLGELAVIQREKMQFAGGRLDMLLTDSENGIRYEVEIMLGATDPSHIIRTIEYWDIERRRYPAYDHVAVLVAEEVTSRFLNVIALLSGSIPLIAIQLNALRVGDHIVLNFVKVLDQRQLREDDTTEAEEQDVDRSTWESRVGLDHMQICDRILQLANETANPALELRYKKGRVGLGASGSFFNVLVMWPKKNSVPMRMPVTDLEAWLQRLKDADIEAAPKANRLWVRLEPEDLRQHETLLRELIHQVVKESQE